MKYDFVLTTAQQRLVEENLDLAERILRQHIHANHYIGSFEREDLLQEGCLALCKAAASYLPGKCQFRTYAYTVVRNHLYDYCLAIQSASRRLPTISMEELPGASPLCLCEAQNVEMRLAELEMFRLTARFKQKYEGVIRLGIEALEWQMRGYSSVDTARLYGTSPNYIRACKSRAAKKLRKEQDIRQYYIDTLGRAPQSA